ATQVLEGAAPVLQRYGVSDDDAFAVGLTCGGIIDIFVERVDQQSFPALGEVAAAVRAKEPVAVATGVEHPGPGPGGGRAGVRRDGVSDDDAVAGGLTGGGIIAIFVERVDQQSFPELGEVAAAVRAKEPVAVATVVEHPDPGRVGARMVVWPDRTSGSLGNDRIDDAVTDDARGMLASGRSGALEYGTSGQRRGEGLRVFVNSFEPPPRMLVFGAIDFASAMARMGSFLGYHVTVCDARPVFATSSRFPGVDEVVVDWPHRYLAAEAEAGRLDSRTAVMVLTHDPKFDVPVLERALRMDLGYVGAMGSRRTHE